MEQLPPLIKQKIYKTGQTRGADDDEIYQNRVGRNSTVLIPHAMLSSCLVPDDGTGEYEKGYIVLVPPTTYFGVDDGDGLLAADGLALGTNALLFFQSRADWNGFDPESLGMGHATSRIAPLGGEFVARIPATTAAEGGSKISKGFTETALKGAGIRVYEYANKATITATRVQLEALFWLCSDSIEIAQLAGMSEEGARERCAAILQQAVDLELLDRDEMYRGRLINDLDNCVCPLCLAPMSAAQFSSKIAQAVGREVATLTVTDASLFHLQELRPGSLNNRPYNLGWGHHHCNVVTKDAGIGPTVDWLREVLQRNDQLKARLHQIETELWESSDAREGQ